MTPLLLTSTTIVAFALLPTAQALKCKEQYWLFAHDRNCSLYVYCDSERTPHLFSCPPPLHFDEVKKVCDWPERVNCTREDSNLKTSFQNARKTSSGRRDDVKVTSYKLKNGRANSTLAQKVAAIKQKEEIKTSKGAAMLNKPKPKEDLKTEQGMEIKNLSVNSKTTGEGVKVATTNGSVAVDNSKTTENKDKSEVKSVKGKREDNVSGGKPHGHSISKREDKTEDKKEETKKENGKVNEEIASLKNKPVLNKPSEEGVKKISLAKNLTLEKYDTAESKKDESKANETLISDEKTINETSEVHVKKERIIEVKKVTFKDTSHNETWLHSSNETSFDLTPDFNISKFNSESDSGVYLMNNEMVYVYVPMNATGDSDVFGYGPTDMKNLTGEIPISTENPLQNVSEPKDESSPKSEIPVTNEKPSSASKTPLSDSAPVIEKVPTNEDTTTIKSSPTATVAPTVK